MSTTVAAPRHNDTGHQRRLRCNTRKECTTLFVLPASILKISSWKRSHGRPENWSSIVKAVVEADETRLNQQQHPIYV